MISAVDPERWGGHKTDVCALGLCAECHPSSSEEEVSSEEEAPRGGRPGPSRARGSRTGKETLSSEYHEYGLDYDSDDMCQFSKPWDSD